MKRVVIKNLSNVQTHGADFATQELADAWIAEQKTKGVRCAWGRPAYTETRAVLDNDGNEIYDITYVPILDKNGNPVLDGDGNPTFRQDRELRTEQVSEPDQFTIEITDVSTEYALRGARESLGRSRAFGNSLVEKFAIENVAMGITAEQSDSLMDKLAKTITALEKGYLETAIRRARQVNPNDYDGQFLTAARLLSYVNEIEAFLGLTLSTEL
jgi:hypothetical protein